MDIYKNAFDSITEIVGNPLEYVDDTKEGFLATISIVYGIIKTTKELENDLQMVSE